MSERARREGHYASLLSRAKSDKAKALVSAICREVMGWELRSGARKSFRGEHRARKFNLAIERFVGDLLNATANPDSEGIIWHRVTPTAFPPGAPVTYTDFQRVRDALIGLSLVEYLPGKGRYASWEGTSIKQEKGTASRFKGTAQLLKRAKDAGVVVTSVDDHFKQEPPLYPLRLKKSSRRNRRHEKIAGATVAFPRTAHARRLETEVVDLNNFLSGFSIEGAHHHAFERIFNEGDKPEHYGWNKGGRLYSIQPPSGQRPYQLLSGAERARITIDGEATCEIDIRACNPTIFHARLKEPFDTSTDPYDPSRTGLNNRDIAKAWTVASFGANSPIKRWSQRTSEEYLKDTLTVLGKQCRAIDARDRMLAAYPALNKIGQQGVTWADLMFAESTVVMQAMTFLMHHGVPSLPVHDSLIVPVSQVAPGCETLLLSFQGVLGVYPWLTTKSSNPVAMHAVQAANERYRATTALSAYDL